jgi:hypothetical protein
MELRDRIIGPVARVDGEGDDAPAIVDFGDLIRKVILFDRLILESIRLKEFPPLIQKFGYDGVKELLDSGRLRVHWEAGGVAQVEQDPKTPGFHRFAMIALGERKKHIHEALQLINDVPDLRGKQAQKLRKLVGEATYTPPPLSGNLTWKQFLADLEANAPVLKRSVAVIAAAELGREVTPSDFALTVEGREGEGFRSETDLGGRLGLDPLQAHEIVSRGLLGVGGLDQRIEFMKRYNAVTGFQAGELPLFEEKLNFLARQLDPEAHEQRFERVLEIAGFPDVDPDPNTHDVDLPRLLELLESDEVREFRTWMRSLDSLDDAEVKREISQLRDAVGRAVHSPIGKVVRFSTVAGIGLIPGAQPAALGLGALDSLLVDKLIPEPGPAAFLGQLFRTVYSKE